METVQDILLDAIRALGATISYQEARLQAELLLAHALDTSRAMMLAGLTDPVTPEVSARYAASVARRAKHEPFAYIVGHKEFYGLDLIVDRRVLIPRHETESLVHLALARARQISSPVIVDVGTGSGAIALVLAHHLSQARVFALDASHDALDVARINAEHLGLTERVELMQSNLLEGFNHSFDLLVANLPYIPTARIAQLDSEIRDHEPRYALDGGEDGLVALRRLVAQLESHAARGATVFLEISEEQGKSAIESIMSILPNCFAQLHLDLEGLDRVVEIQMTQNGER